MTKKLQQTKKFGLCDYLRTERIVRLLARSSTRDNAFWISIICMFNSFLHRWCHTFYYRIPCCAYPLWFFYEVRWAVRYPKLALLFGSKVVSAVQNSPHTFSTRIHHTFLRSKLPRTSIGANIDSRDLHNSFQVKLRYGLHPTPPWGDARG